MCEASSRAARGAAISLGRPCLRLRLQRSAANHIHVVPESVVLHRRVPLPTMTLPAQFKVPARRSRGALPLITRAVVLLHPPQLSVQVPARRTRRTRDTRRTHPTRSHGSDNSPHHILEPTRSGEATRSVASHGQLCSRANSESATRRHPPLATSA